VKSAFSILLVAAIAAAYLLRPIDALPHAATSNTVLFDREIVRILDSHCVMCHMEGGLSVPLETYEQTWLRRDAIHDRILARHMPPWPAVPGYGKFANANDLTLREQRFIVSWVEGLGPRNDGSVFLNVLDPDAAAREPVRARANVGWSLGDPDLDLVLTAQGRNAATAAPGVQRAIVETGLRSATAVAALEYLPADRHAIRAAVFTLEATGQWLATWTPWHGVRRLPDGSAYRLPAGAKISVEIHADEASTDLGRLGLHLAGENARKTPSDITLGASAEAPDASGNQRLRAEAVLDADTEVLALWPVLPRGIESIQLSAVRPDGAVEILLYALEVPFDWPTPYIFETPVILPAGSRLALTAYMSTSNREASAERMDLVLSVIAD